MPKLFTRMFYGSMDAKCRVSLPADFRDVIATRCPIAEGMREQVILDKHPEWPCLRGYDPNFAEALFEQVQDTFGKTMSRA